MTVSEIIIVLPLDVKIPDELMKDLQDNPSSGEYFELRDSQLVHYYSMKWREDKEDVSAWLKLFSEIGEGNYHVVQLREQSTEPIERGDFDNVNVFVETKLNWE